MADGDFPLFIRALWTNGGVTEWALCVGDEVVKKHVLADHHKPDEAVKWLLDV